jgi:hypothetical protein
MNKQKPNDIEIRVIDETSRYSVFYIDNIYILWLSFFTILTGEESAAMQIPWLVLFYFRKNPLVRLSISIFQRPGLL